MADPTIPQGLLPDENDFNPVDPVKYNELIRHFENVLNNIDATNITAGSLTRDKFTGGAVSTTSDVSTSGEANKVIKLDSAGDLNLDGSIKFKRE